MLSIENNFLFIHVPKTGGNAIQRILLPFSDDQIALLNPLHDGIERFEIRSPSLDIHKHSSLADYHKQLDGAVFKKLTKVACIRNPWDRCVSYFFSPHRGEVTWSLEAFEEFIESSILPYAHYLALSDNDPDPFANLDFLIRFENLQEDFSRLCEKLRIGEHNLKRVNASSREDYRSYYKSETTKALVAKKFAAEIEHFNYRF
jgi:hypothetical protein